jgi:hypothetical protein
MFLTCSRMSVISKMRCQSSLKSTFFARVLILFAASENAPW